MKPALGTGGGVGSHLSSPIQRDARSWMTKTMEIDTLPGSGFLNLKKNWKIPKNLHTFKQ